MIRDGFYVGRKVGEEWFVDSSELGNKKSGASGARTRTKYSTDGTIQEVVVTDIQMSFVSMVVFMVKWVMASIPAFIILFIVFYIVTTVVFGGVLGRVLP